MVEIAVRRPFPFAPDKIIRVAPEDIKIPFRLGDMMPAVRQRERPQMSKLQQLQEKKAEADRKAKARKYEMDHLMTAPFRHAGRSMAFAWDGIKRALTKEGFAKVKVKNQAYKLDITGGWALDDGRALDRLVHVRPIELQS
jgi:hypothetical protein